MQLSADTDSRSVDRAAARRAKQRAIQTRGVARAAFDGDPRRCRPAERVQLARNRGCVDAPFANDEHARIEQSAAAQKLLHAADRRRASDELNALVDAWTSIDADAAPPATRDDVGHRGFS